MHGKNNSDKFDVYLIYLNNIFFICASLKFIDIFKS